MNEASKQVGQIEEALCGEHGEDQQRIAKVAVEWVATLLAKNKDYGGSAWKQPVLAPSCDAGTAILVRMSDKVERLGKLLGGDQAAVNESTDDTISDLGAYCLLYLARPGQEY